MATYEVILRAEDTTKKSAVAGTEEKTEKTYGEKTAASLEKGIKGLVSYASFKSTSEQLITAEIGRVELRTGATEYQQRIQTVYTVVDSVFSSGVTIGLGIATGNAPIAIIGTTTKAMGWLIGGIQRQIDLNLKQAGEDISIGMATRRASTNGRRQ